MSFHLLPLLDKHLDTAKANLLLRIQLWLNDWVCKEDVKPSISIELSAVTIDKTQEISKSNYLAAYNITNDRQKYQLAVGYESRFDALLNELLTGCDSSEFKDSLVDMKSLTEQVVEPLIIALGNANSVEAIDSDDLIKQVQTDLKLSQFAVAYLARININDSYFSLLLPNCLLKALIFESTQVKSNQLNSRESVLADYRVTLSAKIDGFSISLQDFSTLQVGDVLTTRQKSTEQIGVYSENNPIIGVTVMLGKKQTQKAIKFV